MKGRNVRMGRDASSPSSHSAPSRPKQQIPSRCAFHYCRQTYVCSSGVVIFSHFKIPLRSKYSNLNPFSPLSQRSKCGRKASRLRRIHQCSPMTKSAKNTGVRVPLIVYRRGAFTSISVFICEARFLPTSRTLHILPPSSSLTKKSDYRLEGRDVEEGSRHQRTRQICERVLRQVREVDKRGSPVFRGGWGYEAAETTCSSRWWSV